MFGLALTAVNAPAQEPVPSGAQSAVPRDRQAEVADRLTDEGKSLFGAGRYADAEARFRQVIAIRTAASGERDFDTASAYSNLAMTLDETGRYAEAEPLYRKALEISRATVGDQSALTAILYNNYGVNLDNRGRHQDAEPLLRKALAIRQAAFGEKHLDTAGSYTNVAANQSAQGHYAEAGTLYRRALDIVVANTGETSVAAAAALSNVASNLSDQGRSAEAEPLFLKALDIKRSVLGDAHPDTGTAYNNAGFNLTERGRYVEAERYLRKALDSYRAAYGENSPKTALAYGNVAECLESQGRYPEAETLFRRALDTYRATLGDENPEIGTAYNNLAALYLAQGRYADAEPLFRRSLAIRIAGLGETSPQSAQAYSNLGVVLMRQGHLAEAEAMLRKADAIDVDVFGPRHPVRATAMSNLAALLFQQGRYAEAEPLLRDALEIKRAALGDAHPDTAQAYDSLASILGSQGRYAEAEPILRKVLGIHLAAFGENHPATATSYNDLARCIDEQQRAAEAEPLLRKALAIRAATLGEKHTDTAQSYNNLAYNQTRQGRWEAAEPLYRKALAIDRDALGEGTPAVATDQNNLADDLSHLGRLAEAETLFRQTLAIRRAAIGEDNDQTAVTYTNLAMTLAAMKRPIEAERTAAIGLDTMLRVRKREAARSREAGDADPGRERSSSQTVYQSYLAVAGEALATSPDTVAISQRALLAAQVLLETASSRAMIRAAARVAAKDPALGEAIRQEQDLEARLAALDQAMLKALATKTAAGADAIRLERERLRPELAALDTRIDRDFPAYRAIISPDPLPLATLGPKVGPDEGLLMLVPTGGDIYLFGIGYGMFVWARVTDSVPQTLARIAHLRCQTDAEACPADPAVDEVALPGRSHSDHYDLAAAYALYRTLVAPVENAFPKAKRLYITASGPLADLPLGALVTVAPAPGAKDDDPDTLARASWLADRYAITYLPAVSGLMLRGGDGAPPGKLIAATRPFSGYGDPALDGNVAQGCARGIRAFAGRSTRNLPVADVTSIRKICPLPNSAGELRRLGAMMGGAPADIHLRDRATESVLASDPDLAGARVVVFSTHGALAGEGRSLGFEEPGLILTPPAAPIALGNGTVDDGVLTASEAARLTLSAEWVVLSACNTASAQGSNGADGLSALARGFLYAGAQSLLASHWRVADDSAAILTVETFRIRRTHPELTHSQVLQAAMRAVRTGEDGMAAIAGWDSSMAHPADWAPFTQISNFDR